MHTEKKIEGDIRFDPVFVVLGGSGTLGRELISYLKKLYATSVIVSTYSNTNQLGEVGADYKLCVDFSKKESVISLAEKVITIVGNKKDVCVIDAIGIYFKENFSNISIDRFERVNAIHCVNFCLFLSQLLKAETMERFACIYISSNLTVRCNRGTYSYIASKIAAESIIRQLGYEYQGVKGYRFNIIAPGYFGDMNPNKREIKNRNVLIDICRAIVFLYETDMINGSKIVIDGGETIGY
ncbi:SDR family NAD(P)-dependent oxidoreductase [Levyella massiliensis]|uniref:SDR family NAD(P)-dependent oxidoreductase n=1 Tax=Levyella massiliensis TaxID=938289 RepID=UPI00037175CD|nr:SDR family oxidoreductase [Levyella massiliensis]